MLTKKKMQQWAREEWARLDAEKTEKIQDECNHARSGTVLPGTLFTVSCDDCKKELTMDDTTRGGPAPPSNGLDLKSLELGGFH